MIGSENKIGTTPKIAYFTALTDVCAALAAGMLQPQSGYGDVEGVGTTRVDQYGNRYRWVYNPALVASRAGAPACYLSANLAAATFMQQATCTPADADVNFLAGIWMAAVPTLGYGWIMTSGIYGTAKMACAETGTSSAAAAVNDVLIASTLTTTSGTNVARAYAFLSDILGVTVAGTGAAGTLTFTSMVRSRARVLSSGTIPASGTPTSPVNVLVQGFI
jgi:hypothetical protein